MGNGYIAQCAHVPLALLLLVFQTFVMWRQWPDWHAVAFVALFLLCADRPEPARHLVGVLTGLCLQTTSERLRSLPLTQTRSIKLLRAVYVSVSRAERRCLRM